MNHIDNNNRISSKTVTISTPTQISINEVDYFKLFFCSVWAIDGVILLNKGLN